MAIPLKQSTAVTVVIGRFVDATDGITPETALTISQADVRLSKNWGSWAQKNDASSCTHQESGFYSCPLNTTDTNTLGPLLLAVNESGAAPVEIAFMVLPAAVYDAFYAGSGTGIRADVQAMAAGVIAAATLAAGAITAAAVATGAIDADALAQDAAREIADEILDRDIAGGASGGARNIRSALRLLRNRRAIAAGTLTVYQEDDTTAAWTAAVATAAGNPVSGIDP